MTEKRPLDTVLASFPRTVLFVLIPSFCFRTTFSGFVYVLYAKTAYRKHIFDFYHFIRIRLSQGVRPVNVKCNIHYCRSKHAVVFMHHFTLDPCFILL